MGREHASAVAGIHQSVLTDSVYTCIGRRFLDYYYENLLKRDDFFCHVHIFNSKVTGFLASTSEARRIFFRHLLGDALRISVVLLRILAQDPGKLGVILSASRFLFMQRPEMLPHVDGEVLSFAVLPEYRTTEVGPDGEIRPTEFYARWKIAVAAELFLAAMQSLAVRGVRDVKIMTPADNAASNRFYTKMGCRLAVTGSTVFGHPTNLYHAQIDELMPGTAKTGRPA